MVIKTVLLKIPEDYHHMLKILAIVTKQTMSQLVMSLVDEAKVRILNNSSDHSEVDQKAVMQRILKNSIKKG